jgi:hypothetical protein
MMLYGLGALAQCQGILGDFDTVRLVIHQPRIKSAPSEWTISVAELEAWGRTVARSSVQEQENAEALKPSQRRRGADSVAGRVPAPEREELQVLPREGDVPSAAQ